MDSVYDRALAEAGMEGRFQKKFDFVINVVLSATWSMVYLHMILALVVVPHTCKLPEKTENITDYVWKLKYIPHKNIYDEIKFDSCSIYANPHKNNITLSCTEYEYDKTWYDSTVSSEKDWVCDKEIYIPNILAYSKITELIGSIFFGWMSDAHGRRITYIISLGLVIIGRIISLLPGRSYWIFLSGCLLSSFTTWSAMQSASLISVEITSAKRRSTITTIRFTAGCVGVAMMAVTYWWVRYWKTFIIVTTSPLLILLILSWNIIESPRWLYTNGKTKECLKQLKIIAKTNKRSLKVETEKELLGYVPQSTVKSLGPLALFSGRGLAINTILHVILWIVGSTCFSLQVLYIGQKPDGNPFLELCWQTISEIPANFFSAWLADHIGRRYAGATSFCIMSTVWSLLAFRETSSSSWVRVGWIGTVLNIFIRWSNAVAYYVTMLLAMELYPTCLRQSGLALGNVFSSAGSIITPYIFFLGRGIDERLPGLVLTLMCICAIISVLLLPETLNAKLPETIEEAMSFGRRNKKYSSVPLRQLSIPLEKCSEQIASEA